MGEWDEANNPIGRHEHKDRILEKFRTEGLELQNNNITVKIYPRFKAKILNKSYLNFTLSPIINYTKKLHKV